MSRWEWLDELREECRRRGDEERLRLTHVRDQAYEFRETDPGRVVAMLAEGCQHARRLGEPWLALHLDYYLAEARMHFTKDYREVLDLAMRCVLEVRKPAFAAYPGKAEIYDNLITAYLGIDPLGYERDIWEALAFLEKEVPPGSSETRYLMMGTRRIFATARRALDEAWEICLESLALADADDDRDTAHHHGTFITCTMCWLSHQKKNWPALGEYSHMAEGLSRLVGNQSELCEALAWQAVYAQQQGDGRTARRALRMAIERSQRLRMPPASEFFDAVEAYYETEGDLEAALRLRDQELATIQGLGQLAYEFDVQVHRCRLKKWLGQLTDEDVAAARRLAVLLKAPEKYLPMLDEAIR